MIYAFLANGFEEIEAISVIDILRRAGHEVKTVGVGGKEIKGSHGISVLTDIADSQVETDDMTMVFLPGGMPGTLNLEKSPIVRASVDYCVKNGMIVAAICAAPSILGHWNLLNGKEAICFPGYEQELFGARISAEPVCADGNIITGKGAGVALEFALKIVEVLSGAEISRKLRASLQCR